MLEGFLLNILERGLSTVDVDDPETSEGVRVDPATSSLGKRDDEVCGKALETDVFEDSWGVGTLGLLPWRVLATREDFGAGAR
jgi:hypothetical protein